MAGQRISGQLTINTQNWQSVQASCWCSSCGQLTWKTERSKIYEFPIINKRLWVKLKKLSKNCKKTMKKHEKISISNIF